MSEPVLKITEVVNQLSIEGETTVILDVIAPVEVSIIEAVEQGPRGIPGQTGPQGDPGGGLAAVQDDPAPILGGDLTLGAYSVIGQLDRDDFVLDGGLL